MKVVKIILALALLLVLLVGVARRRNKALRACIDKGYEMNTCIRQLDQ